MGASGREKKLSNLEAKEIIENSVVKTYVYERPKKSYETQNRTLNLPDNREANQLEISIVKERLRQARTSFGFAAAMTAASAITSLTGAALLIGGVVPAGLIVAAGGLLGASSFKLTKDANDRLDKLAEEMSKEEI